MEPGGTLRIDLRHSGGMAEMAFADDGCGMAPDVLENIFEPFFTRRRVGKGTGLGLSITHRIINQHQGEIAADEPRRGPGRDLHRPPPRPALRAGRDAAGRGRGLRPQRAREGR